MEKYKRLTDKKATTENTKVVYNENGFAMFHKELVEALLEEHNRLWELENKIENGTLVDTTNVWYEKAVKDGYNLCKLVPIKMVIDVADTEAEAEKKIKGNKNENTCKI